MYKYLITILLAVFSFSVMAQIDEDDYTTGSNGPGRATTKGKFDWSRVTVGGGLGLSFGSFTLIDVSPNVGYYLTDNILAGVGGTYIYYKDSYLDYSTDVYGARVFGQYFFNDFPVLLHAEVENINYYAYSVRSRVDVMNVLLGGGIRQAVGGRSFVSIIALWNVNESEHSFYPNPIIRGGVAIGL